MQEGWGAPRVSVAPPDVDAARLSRKNPGVCRGFRFPRSVDPLSRHEEVIEPQAHGVEVIDVNESVTELVKGLSGRICRIVLAEVDVLILRLYRPARSNLIFEATPKHITGVSSIDVVGRSG